VAFEDTRAPNPPRIKNAYSIGSMNLVSLEWFNEDENNESYSIWRHYGEPFGEDENDVSTIDTDGWELVLGDIDATLVMSDTLTREFTIPPSVDRNVWYAVTITDEFGNFNGEIFAGFGGNAFKVAEDTLLPNGDLTVFDDEGLLYDSTTLVAGQYTLRVQVNEDHANDSHGHFGWRRLDRRGRTSIIAQRQPEQPELGAALHLRFQHLFQLERW
jgi:hypothetical protein